MYAGLYGKSPAASRVKAIQFTVGLVSVCLVLTFTART